MRSANGVVLERNANLTHVGGLSDLRTLLTNNTKLPTCLATALRTQVAAHLFSSTISGNLEPSTSCP